MDRSIVFLRYIDTSYFNILAHILQEGEHFGCLKNTGVRDILAIRLFQRARQLPKTQVLHFFFSLERGLLLCFNIIKAKNILPTQTQFRNA